MHRLLMAAIMLMAGNVLWAAANEPTPGRAVAVKGTVLEVKEVESYSYLRMKTADGEIWAAVMRMPIKVGTEVTIENPMTMRNFESRSLNRKFDKIIFGSVAGAGSATSSLSGHGSAKPADLNDVKVARAPGRDARTVAEIITKRGELKDKPVLLRAKVTKFTQQVMGKNWMHLQDGSGSATDGTHDLVVSTKDKAAIGDVVLVRGIVRTDRELGSGYTYKVLLEDAQLQK